MSTSDSCSIQANRELMESFLIRNSYMPLERKKNNSPLTLEQRFAPYGNCLKLAKLWILQDLKKIHDDERRGIFGMEGASVKEWAIWTNELPLEVKYVIISFIPTFSSTRNIYDGQFVHLDNQMMRDPFFVSYLKHRLISNGAKSYLEGLIFEQMSREGLDLSKFFWNVTPLSKANRANMIRSLLRGNEKFMINGEVDFNFQTINLVSFEEDLPMMERLFQNSQEFPIYEETDDSIEDCDTEESNQELEKKLLSEMPNDIREIKLKFQSEPELEIDSVKLLASQNTERNDIHNAFSYGVPFIKYADSEKLEVNENDDIFTNHHVKRLRISFFSTLGMFDTVPTILSIVSRLKNLQELEIEVGTVSSMAELLQELDESILKNLKSLRIYYYGHLSHFVSFFSGTNMKNVYLTTVIDSTDDILDYLTSYNVYVNQDLLEGEEAKDERANLYIEQFKISDVKSLDNPITNKLLAFATFFNIYNIQDRKQMVEIITKRNPLSLFSQHLFVNETVQNPISAALLQYMIYLSNTHHDGVIFSSIPYSFTEKGINFMIQSGWDINNNFMQIIGNLGPESTEIVLNHISKLIKEKLFKIDIEKARKFLLVVINEKYCRLLRFICENCTEEERIYLFSSVKFYETSLSYYETNIFNHLVNAKREHAIMCILPHVPRECLLQKTSRKTNTSLRYFTVLHYAICNTQISNDIIVKLIEIQPLLIDMADNEGISPLHLIAITIGRWSLVEVWKKHGANMHAKNSMGQTPLDYAKRENPKFHFLFEELIHPKDL